MAGQGNSLSQVRPNAQDMRNEHLSLLSKYYNGCEPKQKIMKLCLTYLATFRWKKPFKVNVRLMHLTGN